MSILQGRYRPAFMAGLIIYTSLIATGCHWAQPAVPTKPAPTGEVAAQATHEISKASPPKPRLGSQPWIHSIGDASPILIFEPTKELRIPLYGQNLRDGASTISISVAGVAPLKPGEDYSLDTTNTHVTDALVFIQFTTNATARLNPKDQLVINVTIAERPKDLGVVHGQYDLAGLLNGLVAQLDTNNGTAASLDSGLAKLLGVKAVLAGWNTDQIKSLGDFISIPSTNRGSPSAASLAEAFKTGQTLGRTLLAGSTNGLVFHSPAGKLLASRSRTFTLFTSQVYRDTVLSHQIEEQNITAYPLNYAQSRDSFGDYVATHYYPVRLTLRNPSEQDQIIQLGAVTAQGRILVASDTTNSGPMFSVPVSLAPVSAQNIYSLVKDTLAGGNGDFLRNITNFAMADTVTIAKDGGSVHEVCVFFAKTTWPSILQDPYLNGSMDWQNLNNESKPLARHCFEPLFSLTLDSLQIPFKTATNSEAQASGNTNNSATPAAPQPKHAAAVIGSMTGGKVAVNYYSYQDGIASLSETTGSAPAGGTNPARPAADYAVSSMVVRSNTVLVTTGYRLTYSLKTP